MNELSLRLRTKTMASVMLFTPATAGGPRLGRRTVRHHQIGNAEGLSGARKGLSHPSTFFLSRLVLSTKGSEKGEAGFFQRLPWAHVAHIIIEIPSKTQN